MKLRNPRHKRRIGFKFQLTGRKIRRSGAGFLWEHRRGQLTNARSERKNFLQPRGEIGSRDRVAERTRVEQIAG